MKNFVFVSGPRNHSGLEISVPKSLFVHIFINVGSNIDAFDFHLSCSISILITRKCNGLLVTLFSLAGSGWIWNPEHRNDTQKRREVTAEKNRPQMHDNFDMFNVIDKNEQNSFSKTRFCLPKPVPANSNFK